MDSIDWDELLDAGRGDARDAYDAAVDGMGEWEDVDSSGLEDFAKIVLGSAVKRTGGASPELDREQVRLARLKALRNFCAGRKLTPYFLKREEREEREAVKEQLERQLHTELQWVQRETLPPDSLPVLMDTAAHRAAAEDVRGRIVFLSDASSIRAGVSDYKDICYHSVLEEDEDDLNRLCEDGLDSRCMGMKWSGTALVLSAPLRSEGVWVECKEDSGGKPLKKIVFTRHFERMDKLSEKKVTWVFRRFRKDGRTALKPVELWYEHDFLWQRLP